MFSFIDLLIIAYHSINDSIYYVSIIRTAYLKGYTLAVMNVGAPAGGMNPATKACVRSALNKGHSVLAISDGFDGLSKGQV